MDFPTPPLPEPIAMMLLTPGTLSGPCCGLGCPPTFRFGGFFSTVGADRATEALVTPGRDSVIRSAAFRSGSICLAISAEGASITKRTVPLSMEIARSISRLTSVPPSGRASCSNAALMSS